MFVCLFGVYRPTPEFFRHMETTPHLLWHGASVYNGHLPKPKTLTLIAERLALELSLPVFTTCHGWDSNIEPFACEANALTHCATATVSYYWKEFQIQITQKYTSLKSRVVWEILRCFSYTDMVARTSPIPLHVVCRSLVLLISFDLNILFVTQVLTRKCPHYFKATNYLVIMVPVLTFSLRIKYQNR